MYRAHHHAERVLWCAPMSSAPSQPTHPDLLGVFFTCVEGCFFQVPVSRDNQCQKLSQLDALPMLMCGPENRKRVSEVWAILAAG